MDPSDPSKHERAWEWSRVLWESGLGSLSWQVLNEFYLNAPARLPVVRPEARKIVRGYSQWAPVETSLGLIERAWHWMEQTQL